MIYKDINYKNNKSIYYLDKINNEYYTLCKNNIKKSINRCSNCCDNNLNYCYIFTKKKNNNVDNRFLCNNCFINKKFIQDYFSSFDYLYKY